MVGDVDVIIIRIEDYLLSDITSDSIKLLLSCSVLYVTLFVGDAIAVVRI